MIFDHPVTGMFLVLLQVFDYKRNADCKRREGADESKPHSLCFLSAIIVAELENFLLKTLSLRGLCPIADISNILEITTIEKILLLVL